MLLVRISLDLLRRARCSSRMNFCQWLERYSPSGRKKARWDAGRLDRRCVRGRFQIWPPAGVDGSSEIMPLVLGGLQNRLGLRGERRVRACQVGWLATMRLSRRWGTRICYGLDLGHPGRPPLAALEYWFYVWATRRKMRAPRASAPKPKSVMVDGSGTGEVLSSVICIDAKLPLPSP